MKFSYRFLWMSISWGFIPENSTPSKSALWLVQSINCVIFLIKTLTLFLLFLFSTIKVNLYVYDYSQISNNSIFQDIWLIGNDVIKNHKIPFRLRFHQTNARVRQFIIIHREKNKIPCDKYHYSFTIKYPLLYSPSYEQSKCAHGEVNCCEKNSLQLPRLKNIMKNIVKNEIKRYKVQIKKLSLQKTRSLIEGHRI